MAGRVVNVENPVSGHSPEDRESSTFYSGEENSCGRGMISCRLAGSLSCCQNRRRCRVCTCSVPLSSLPASSTCIFASLPTCFGTGLDRRDPSPSSNPAFHCPAFHYHCLRPRSVLTSITMILNVAAVGTDTVPAKFPLLRKVCPLRWLFPQSWNCDPAVIEPGESSPPSVGSLTMSSSQAMVLLLRTSLNSLIAAPMAW